MKRRTFLKAVGVVAVTPKEAMSFFPLQDEVLTRAGLTREEICLLFDVPPGLVGIHNNTSYANAEMMMKHGQKMMVEKWNKMMTRELEKLEAQNL